MYDIITRGIRKLEKDERNFLAKIHVLPTKFINPENEETLTKQYQTCVCFWSLFKPQILSHAYHFYMNSPYA